MAEPADNGIWTLEQVATMLQRRCQQWTELCKADLAPLWLQQIHEYARSLPAHAMPDYQKVYCILYSGLNRKAAAHSIHLQAEE